MRIPNSTALVVLALFLCFVPHDVAAGPEGARVPTLVQVRPSLGSGPPGTTVTMTRTSGSTRLDSNWRVSFLYEGPSCEKSEPLGVTSATGSQLSFTIPSDAGCGEHRIFVFLGSEESPQARSNAVTYRVSPPCLPVPTVSSASPRRALPGEVLSLAGSGFRAGAQLRVYRSLPYPRRVQEFQSASADASGITFRLPASPDADLLCGEAQVCVKDPALRTPSNLASFYFTCPANRLDVLTYNVQLFPPQSLPGVGCVAWCDTGWRTRELPKNRIVDDHDVVVLQEAFSDSHRHQIYAELMKKYPHHTKVVGGDRGFEQDGGVVILSRWPIENSTYWPLNTIGNNVGSPECIHRRKGSEEMWSCAGTEKRFGGVCDGGPCTGDIPWDRSGGDCCADKGFVYARINKEGRRYNIIGTHLDSDDGFEDYQARKKQLAMIHDFIRQLAIDRPISESEATIVVGDLNIDKNNQPRKFAMPRLVVDEYQEMLSALGAVHPEVQGGTDTSPECDSYLDYVLYLKPPHLQPIRAINDIREARAWEEHVGEHLSDHHPVVGIFEFPLQSAVEGGSRVKASNPPGVVKRVSAQ